MEEKLKQKIKDLIASSNVFLFMKGTPKDPACGFSWKVVETLENLKISFGSFDVLKNEEVRQGIKEFANWPTIPQLYINQKFVGGCDITLQLAESGELLELVKNSLPN